LRIHGIDERKQPKKSGRLLLSEALGPRHTAVNFSCYDCVEIVQKTIQMLAMHRRAHSSASATLPKEQ
jgi:hypothetical protein